MKILVIGSGGREHAIVRTLARAPSKPTLYCAPGNPGIAADAQVVPIPADDIGALLTFAKDQNIDLTMVGPEAPLVAGIADRFRAEGLAIVGPTKSAAQLEGSKSFAKAFMERHGIPTARYRRVTSLAEGVKELDNWPDRSVLKADGLAAGKGVKVCQTRSEAVAFLQEVMGHSIFGAAGSSVVIEECLDGEEATVLAFCDGKSLVTMPASQDHKRLSDGDEGPNTGGMGAYAPAPCITPALQREIERLVCEPFLEGIRTEGFDFRGIIYFGLMLTPKGPKVLEFNVRFGDPETQAVLPLLDSDFAQVLKAVADGQLEDATVRWKEASALCVVLASGGYPGAFAKGKVIQGLETGVPDTFVYHAGTAKAGPDVVTSGGRVLGVTGVARTFEKARENAYAAVSKISYEGMTYRRDIGARALKSGVRS